LHNGAQPTELLKQFFHKGALLKHHLDGGIRKGALTQEQADAKLATWLEAKNWTVDAKKEGLTKLKPMLKLKLKAEQDNAKRLATAAKAEADAIAAATPAVEEEEVAEVESTEETPAEENNEETQA
jgi:small subunit ribosomal protein S16